MLLKEIIAASMLSLLACLTFAQLRVVNNDEFIDYLQRVHRERHRRSRTRLKTSAMFDSAQDHFKTDIDKKDKYLTPCNLPPVTSAYFPNYCTQYLRKPYICSVGQALSLTEVTPLEEILAGKYSFCKYDRIQAISQSYPLADDLLISREAAMRQKEKDDAIGKKHLNTHGPPPGTRRRRKKLVHLLRPLNRRPNIAITVLEVFKQVPLDHTQSLFTPKEVVRKISKVCPDIHPPYPSTNLTTKQALDYSKNFYANVSRDLFSDSTCQTDISVLVLGHPKSADSTNAVSPTIHISFSGKFEAILGQEARNAALSISHQPYLKTGMKLIKFSKKLTQILDQKYPPNPARKYHSIPRWATALFVLCMLLSGGAVFLSRVVTKKGKGRRAIPGAKHKRNSRKWGAGFTGGMWGAS